MFAYTFGEFRSCLLRLSLIVNTPPEIFLIGAQKADPFAPVRRGDGWVRGTSDVGVDDLRREDSGVDREPCLTRHICSRRLYLNQVNDV